MAGLASVGFTSTSGLLFDAFAAAPAPDPGFRLVDVTAQAGIHFRHSNGAYGGKLLPETLGAGCAFLDYDGDGWQDILLVSGTDWPGHRREHKSEPSTLKLYRNNRNGTFSDVTQSAGLHVEMYGMGVAVGDYDNDGLPDVLITCVGQNRLFKNTGKGTFVDVTKSSGLGGRQAMSTSALWFDFDRDGLLDLFVCNYVKWSPEHDVFCSLDGKHKSYCTPEAYRGETCWLFHNRGNGTFEDVTATSGIFDSSSKSLGVAMLDYDHDGWPDLLVTNDTQPNKLYRNQRNGSFKDVAVEAGVAFSAEGRARAGMGVDVADFENSGNSGVAITNFDNEMTGLYRLSDGGNYVDVAMPSGVGLASKDKLGFGCVFLDANLDGALDLAVVNGHIDDTVRNVSGVGYAQPPQLFLNSGRGTFVDVAAAVGGGFSQPKVGRGLAYGDFDRDGDLDLLITTNNGPAYLYRADQTAGNRSIRIRLVGTKSNRDAIGASLKIVSGTSNGTLTQSRLVKSGSSYLSQSELPVTFGLGKRDTVDRLIIDWPNGRTEEYKNLSAGKAYECVEAKGITAQAGF
ncbi:MAG TPA: CRTAC1 family protein [Terriglobales bacterium]|jgi:enediyne biosynthesis protein E4|nr:CRTAC1 family protein [Terriglobales bacterium]